MAIANVDYETQGGAEKARIFRDRLRGVESEHLGIVADSLAGREYDSTRADVLTGRINALKDAIVDAEADAAGQNPA